MNVYAYCAGNPVISADPSGLDWDDFQAYVWSWYVGQVTLADRSCPRIGGVRMPGLLLFHALAFDALGWTSAAYASPGGAESAACWDVAFLCLSLVPAGGPGAVGARGMARASATKAATTAAQKMSRAKQIGEAGEQALIRLAGKGGTQHKCFGVGTGRFLDYVIGLVGYES